jgi:hypothetical protein
MRPMHEAIPRDPSSLDEATDVAERLNVQHGGLSEVAQMAAENSFGWGRNKSAAGSRALIAAARV